MRRRLRLSVLAVAAALPLLTGCAVGWGNYGPGAAGLFRWRRAHSGTSFVETRRDERGAWGYWVPFFYPAQQTYWRGALTGGLTYGTETATFTGARDSTFSRVLHLHSDVVVNLPGDVMSLGARLGYMSTEFPGKGERLKYKGYSAGPSVFLRLLPFANVDASWEHIFGSVEDVDGTYYFPKYNFLGPDMAMPGSRVQADVNVFLYRSKTADLCVRAGYQRTHAARDAVFTRRRELTSEGPFAEFLLLRF